MSAAEENKFKARLVRTSSKDSIEGADSRGKLLELENSK